MAIMTKIVLTKTNPDSEPKPDLGKCGICGETFKVEDCEVDYGHHNGWEMPEYGIHLCPAADCLDGFIEDYDYSNEQLAKWEAWKKRQEVNPK